jgi:predicted TIM-barrel fold metal-dependent hydrolase
VRDIGGTAVHERFRTSGLSTWDIAAPKATDPRLTWRAAAPWWGWPTGNTLDRATVHLPRLLCERLDEFGIDVAILYPSHGLSLGHGLAYRHALDPELAQVVSRAMNVVYAEMFRPYAHRLIPVASIPMHTPDAAVEETEHAVTVLGFRAIRISGYAVRPIPRIHDEHPDLLPFVNRFDTFGLDSAYDYDPFWGACVRLGVAPVAHSGLLNRPNRSVSSYVFNHIAGLAHAHEGLCKSLFLGGVPHRFPELRVGFLEGGVAWACSLLGDLIGHWEKRNVGALERNLDPARLDLDRLTALVREYGDGRTAARADDIRRSFERPIPRPENLDEFAACGIEKGEDIAAQFTRSFSFGCEADDRMVAWAFDERVNPYGARLRAMYGSDIGHWDVPDMAATVAEAHELVEDGLLTEDDFRDFVFTNAVRLHAGPNPAFFDGTVVAGAVEQLRRSGALD